MSRKAGGTTAAPPPSKWISRANVQLDEATKAKLDGLVAALDAETPGTQANYNIAVRHAIHVAHEAKGLAGATR